MSPTLDTKQPVYSVSELNVAARQLLEEHFPRIWIEGELSNFACPGSGHWYFSLKDAKAQIRCAMFQSQNRACKQRPKDGDHVLLRANVSLYEGRGDYQLIVDHLELAGDGLLQRAFEALKNKLEKEGLFLPENKKPIPKIPRQIGVITSPTGAAIRDVLSVLKRRMSSIPVIIYPCSVQGQLAAAEIVHAIETANARNECDVLLLTRGGGSLEDLWPFNEEIVARAIFKSKIPIVSGVGHEIDFTIADFVADQRAPTPSAAAECVSPNHTDILNLVARFRQQLQQHIRHQLDDLVHKMRHLRQRLETQHPRQKLTQQSLQLDHLEKMLIQAQLSILAKLDARCQQQAARLQQCSPLNLVERTSMNVMALQKKLQVLMEKCVRDKNDLFIKLVATLDAISPLATLKRGYSILRDAKHNVIQNSSQVHVGDHVEARLADGVLECVVSLILP